MASIRERLDPGTARRMEQMVILMELAHGTGSPVSNLSAPAKTKAKTRHGGSGSRTRRRERRQTQRAGGAKHLTEQPVISPSSP